MIYNFLRFADEAEAIELMPHWRYTDEQGQEHWRQVLGLANLTTLEFITAWEVVDYSDTDNPITTSPRQTASGYWMGIVAPEADPELWALDYVVHETDRLDGLQYQSKTKLTPEQIARVKGISGLWAGVLTKFGGG